MRVVHVCLSNFFVDRRLYQENELVREHVGAGHAVLVLASTETHDQEGRITYVDPCEYISEEGARVVRLPYHPLLPGMVGRKLRVHRGVSRVLSEFRPDAILFHGLCGWELLTVAKYADEHPEVLLYADSHEDANNSARTFLSRELLHRRYYGPILRRALPSIKKLLCISTETIEFVSSTYRIDREHLEFFPLGGRPIALDEYNQRRNATREAHGFKPEDVVFVQSGKQTARKKLPESLAAFREAAGPRFRLVIAGSLFEDVRDVSERLISQDPRVSFVGWQSPADLTDLLCAADVYLQPGTQSVTMQHSLCARCAVIIDDVPSHRVYHRNNGWLINGAHSLTDILQEVALRTGELPRMQDDSFKIAQELLDYTALANRVLR